MPVRGVFELLGFTPTWNSEQGLAVLSQQPGTTEGDIWVEILIPTNPAFGDIASVTIMTFAMRNGNITLTGGFGTVIHPEVPQQIINGRVMLPLRAIAEAIGAAVLWDDANMAAVITTSSGATPQQPPTVPMPPQEEVPVRPPVVSGFVDINGIAPVEKTIDEWRASVERTTSSIQLPNRRLTDAERQAWMEEYQRLGGKSAFELEVVRLVNETRVEHGLNQLVIDPLHSKATRFYVQAIRNLQLPVGHREGHYGSVRGVGIAWGCTRIGGGIGHAGHRTPQDVVNGWMNSEEHQAILLSPTSVSLGFGSVIGGQFNAFAHYMVFSWTN